jgi:PTH1 family peptidyl-tRNA hydrolase
MNIQGRPISKHFNKFRNSELIIVQDDLENDVGRYKIRAAGTSPRGHNGLKSVIQYLGNHHRKLAIGIGKTPPSQHMAQHVLGKFDTKELEIIDYEVIPKVVAELEKILDPPKRRQKHKNKEKSKKTTKSGKTEPRQNEKEEINSQTTGITN